MELENVAEKIPYRSVRINNLKLLQKKDASRFLSTNIYK